MKQSGCWPTPQQELLLRASLCQGDEALAAWQQWQAQVDFEQLDYGSFRILPLLYQNLNLLKIEHPWLPRLKGIYRRTWYQNRLRFYRLAEVLHRFHAAGIPTMLLKGAALVPLYYQDYGARVMNDLDVLVPTQQALAAARLLGELGFHQVPHQTPEKVVERSRKWVHSISFQDVAGNQLDLHWHVLLLCREPDADKNFWQDRVPLQLPSVATSALHPADMLLHVCVHATQWEAHSLLRWIPDALMIMRASSAFDWQRLLAQTEQRRLMLPMKETLSYLYQSFAMPIPSLALQYLNDLPISRQQVREYQALSSAPDLQNPFFYTEALFRQFVSGTQGLSLWPRGLAFFEYLQFLAGKERGWEAPFYVLYKGLRRIAILCRNKLRLKPLSSPQPQSPRV